MKAIFFLLLAVFSTSAFAEHDATYCGKVLEGTAGKDNFFSDYPEGILAIEYRIVDGAIVPWDQGYGALWALDANQTEFVQKAIKSSRQKGTLFCVKARWGGAAYSSTSINDISLSTDAVVRIDYMSAF